MAQTGKNVPAMQEMEVQFLGQEEAAQVRSNSWAGEGNGYPLQYSCLENFMQRGASQATVHGIVKSQT